MQYGCVHRLLKWVVDIKILNIYFGTRITDSAENLFSDLVMAEGKAKFWISGIDMYDASI